jgi:Fic family protein
MSGTTVEIEWNGRPARAWLPDPLSARPLDLPIEVARATERAAAGVARVADRLPSGWEPLARLLLRAEGIASSNIEGLRAPAAQVAAAELDAAAAPHDAGLVADNLAVVTDALAHARESHPLTTADLHDWHARLMRNRALAPNLIGAFRDTQGWIGGRGPQDAVYVPPPAPNVPALMDDLITFANSDDADVITQAAVSHAQFETIHPYGEGNGRIGRLLVLWTLARRLDVSVPPPTSVLIARDPGGYLSGLHWFRTGELARWVKWFADVVAASSAAAVDWASEVDTLMNEWRARIADVRADAAARSILEILPAHPVITAATAARRTNVSDTAARGAIVILHERAILEPYEVPGAGRGRPRNWWLAKELADLVRV